MTRDEVLKRMLKMKPKQRKTMKLAPPKPVKPLGKILNEDRVGHRERLRRAGQPPLNPGG